MRPQVALGAHVHLRRLVRLTLDHLLHKHIRRDRVSAGPVGQSLTADAAVAAPQQGLRGVARGNEGAGFPG